METRIEEIGAGIYRLETVIAEAGPGGFGFNQFLIDADEPLLFHTGMRALFPLVASAVARLMPLSRLRWISFGHIEADECGALDRWLDAAPSATPVHTPLCCEVSLGDMAARAPRALPEGEVLDLGGKRVRLVPTPHVPHNWEAAMLFEDTTRTLFAGDLGANLRHGRGAFDDDLVTHAFAADDAFPGVSSLAPGTGARIRGLAALEPTTLATMHGASYRGDGARVLRELAAGYDERVRRALGAMA